MSEPSAVPGKVGQGAAEDAPSAAVAERLRRRKPPRLVHGRDIRSTMLYLMSAIVVRTLPRRSWVGAARVLARVTSGRRKKAPDDFPESALDAVTRGELSADRKQAILKGGAYGARSTILLAALRRRRELTPSVKLVGGEKVEAALAEGRGVILWFDRLPMATVMGKRAFAEAGHRMWYLSGSRHGFSYSRFANRFLNWRMIDVELRYVAGRIIFDSASVVVATRKLKKILEANGIVGIANNAVMGKTMNVPFAGGTAITIATAPLSLAISCGACLLPVAVLEIEPFSRFEVVIGPEIAVPPLPKGAQVRAMAEDYARYAVALAKAHPEVWDWSSLAKA